MAPDSAFAAGELRQAASLYSRQLEVDGLSPACNSQPLPIGSPARSAGTRSRRAAIVLLLAGIGGCEGGGTVPEAIVTVESARVRSPDQRLDAVITAERGAPVVGVVNYVFIVSAGAAITRADQPAAAVRDVSPALQVQWVAPDLVELTYEKARFQYFTNAAILRASAPASADVVELRLRPLRARALQVGPAPAAFTGEPGRRTASGAP